jgi:hypothetical protein
VNALHKCSHVPVELLRGLHKGNVSTMIVIDARRMRDMASNIVRGGGQDNTIVFPLDNHRGDLDRLQYCPLSNSRINMPWREAGKVTELKPTR